MIWKDRIIQYPHRYTLTNVSGTTYDFTEVTGEVNEVGTPVSAENMNKLLQRDGDDIKDTVTTFTEAGTRANIATGESTATLFGKIRKWFTDLKPHSFANPSTSQATTTNTVPSDKLLNESSFARVYRFITDINSEFSTATTTPLEILTAMENQSVAYIDINVVNPNMPANYGTFRAYRYGAARADCEFEQKIVNSTESHRWIAEAQPSDTSNKFSGWKEVFTTDKISTVMPISSAAASNEKVLSEKLTYDEFANRTYTRVYKSFAELGLSEATATPADFNTAMVGNSIFMAQVSPTTAIGLAIPTTVSSLSCYLNVHKIGSNSIEFRVIQKVANSTTSIMLFGAYRSTDISNNFSGWKQLAPTDNPTFTGTVTVPAPTNPTDAARLQDVTGLSAVYDKVIRTQAEFEALIVSPTWFDAKSVAFVGQFTLSTADNSGVKIPATVKQIHGFNSAKITITNFKFNASTAKGGLWYDTAPTTKDYSIRDLEVSCTGMFGYGFYRCNNLSNCTGTGTGTDTGMYTSSSGFEECNNLSNCTGRGTGTNGHGNGFFNINYAVNCKDGGSSTAMWGGTNKNIDLDTCRKTLVTADNSALNT